MNDQILNKYSPDFVPPPGDTLLETLESIGMSQAELARRTGRPKKTINEIVKGKAAITPETALQFEHVLGISASFWNNRENQYRDWVVRKQEKENLKQHRSWIKKFPIKAMAKLGWINHCDNPIEQIQELLSFFGIASPEQWDDIFENQVIVFRRSFAFQSDPIALSAWLRKGEIEGLNSTTTAFNEIVFLEALKDAKNLTTSPVETWKKQLVSLCAKAGVIVVFVPQLPKTHVSGATRWLSQAKPIIQLSLRYKTDDHLWFSFFHEAGHIILKHGKRKIFVNEDGETENEEEKDANQFARDCLIPLDKYKEYTDSISNRKYSAESVKEFAASINIAPGIVVGRLQHDKELPYSHLNKLKTRLEWINKQ